MNKILLNLALMFILVIRIPAIGQVDSTPDVKPEDTLAELYQQCGLHGCVSMSTFKKAMDGYYKFGTTTGIVAICDFSKPSCEERFYIIDVKNKKLLVRSLVAHGKNSGGVMATSFSNTPESLQSSLGFYRIGYCFDCQKHGASLILNGLEPGLNDNARMRGIIIHGADYVSETFVKKYGYSGKSFGCPALPNNVIPKAIPILKDGALLFICSGK